MHEPEEGEILITRLGPIDRIGLEALVDHFIANELPSPAAGCIAYAARAFDERAATLPESQRLVVARFAAALRERLARLRRH